MASIITGHFNNRISCIFIQDDIIHQEWLPGRPGFTTNNSPAILSTILDNGRVYNQHTPRAVNGSISTTIIGNSCIIHT